MIVHVILGPSVRSTLLLSSYVESPLCGLVFW